MQGRERRLQRDEIYSKRVRAGKRTYFIDVKATRSKEQYLTITESTRRFNEGRGKFVFDKHTIFLYPEDFDKFVNGLTDAISYIENGGSKSEVLETEDDNQNDINTGIDVNFEDLGNDITE